jgi:rhamnose transport system permease protein
MDLSFMVLGMIFILMLGDIDVSIASIMIVSAMVIGILYQAGAGVFIAIMGGLLSGATCGFINGYLIAKFKMPSVIVTISTALLFRGIVKIVLDVNVLKNYPDWFSDLSWNNFLGVPIVLLIFLLFAFVFMIILHKTKFGRILYAIGNSETVSKYSGIAVNKTKIITFVLMGIMAAVSSIFFAGRLGGISSTMAKGYELDVIAIAVLGGISTNGGKGKVYGPVIAVLIMTFLYYILGLLGVDANVRKIITGMILIIAILIPSINTQLIKDLKLKLFYGNDKEIELIIEKSNAEIKKLKEKRKAIITENSSSMSEKKIMVKEIEVKIDSIKIKSIQQAKQIKKDKKNIINHKV